MDSSLNTNFIASGPNNQKTKYVIKKNLFNNLKFMLKNKNTNYFIIRLKFY